MTTAIPSRLRLDNAANIYPASRSKHYESLYRMSLRLSEPIDREVLGKALERVSARIPTFRCRLQAGAFWWFLKRSDEIPVVQDKKPLKLMSFNDQKGLLYRVSVDGNELCLDIFHALTDGYGALSFILTLAAEYLRLRHGVSVPYNSLVLDPSEAPVYSEVEDSFKTVFTGQKGELEKNVDAYHIKGNVMPEQKVTDVRAVMDMERIKSVCRDYDCSVTELMTAVMISALQQEYRRSKGDSSILKVSVPVNLRPMFGSRTMRNFSSYLNLGIDAADGYHSFYQIVSAVKKQKKADLESPEFKSKIAANVELEEMLIVKLLPLFIKRPIIDWINLHHGDRFVSQTLSNMGEVKVPEALGPYIQSIDFILGRQRGNSGAVSCLGFNGKFYLHMTRKIRQDSFEKSVLRRLKILGIPTQVSIENIS